MSLRDALNNEKIQGWAKRSAAHQNFSGQIRSHRVFFNPLNPVNPVKVVLPLRLR